MLQFSRRTVLAGGACASLVACASDKSVGVASSSPVSFAAFDPAFDEIVDQASSARLLAEGYVWAEGPAWDAQRQALYFTDVPSNRAYRWTAANGVEVFLDPSGVAPEMAIGFREPGANGLLMGRSGELLLCNHGKRSVEAMNVASRQRRPLAESYGGKKFNSPNDLIEAADGTLYFTDPPYGMEGLNASPLKEMAVNGVYRRAANGEVTRIVDNMTFPNGVALSPDQTALYIAQSDPDAPLVRRIDLEQGGEGELWFDARPYMDGHAGLPDGMAVAETGHVFLAGPGGVLVINPAGACLGRIGTGRATANCTFGEDGRTLFMTAQNRLVTIRTRVRGLGRF